MSPHAALQCGAVQQNDHGVQLLRKDARALQILANGVPDKPSAPPPRTRPSTKKVPTHDELAEHVISI